MIEAIGTILYILMGILFTVAIFMIIGTLIYLMFFDDQESSYIHRDGTIREWDKHGNVATVYPNGQSEVRVADPERGLGPLYETYRGEPNVKFTDEVLEEHEEGPHPSHKLYVSDSSLYDYKCTKCHYTDHTGGGWGELVNPCKENKDG